MSDINYTSATAGLTELAKDGGFIVEPEETKPIFEWIPMPVLMSKDYRVRYLCNGVLAKGQPAIVGGPQKSFKTSLALELAVCLATGEDFLGHFSVPEAVKVCYFSGEGGLGVIQDTLRRIGQAKGIDVSKIENLIVTDRVPQLDNVTHLELIREHIEQYRPSVVFVDPLYLAMSGADTSNVFSMGERLRELNEVCLPYDCTPVLLHHLRKTRMNAYIPAGLEDLSMAGFAEYAGQWVLLSRRTAYNPDDPTHRLWLTLGGRTGHGSQWGLDILEGTNDSDGGRIWQASLRRQDEIRSEIHSEICDEAAERKAAKEQAKQTEFEALCNRVLTWIKGKPNGVTKREIRGMFRVGADKADQIVMNLEEAGHIESCDVTVKVGKSAKGERVINGYRAVAIKEEKNLFDDSSE